MSGKHYLSVKLTDLPIAGGKLRGVFAIADIAKGEVLAVWGGRILTLDQLKSTDPMRELHAVQVEKDLFLAPINQMEPANYFNHSCNPSAGLRGQITLVSMRAIAQGEQVCYDYAMSEASSYNEFDCLCGGPNCRHQITGDDWKLTELWERYRGYFSPHVRRKINAWIEERGLHSAGV